MLSRFTLLAGMLAVFAAAPHAAGPRQSFLYVASPQTPCAGSGYPCPPSEVLVFDSTTGGLVTRIPLIADSAEHALAFAPDGRSLYAFGNGGTTKIDTTTHTATILPIRGTAGGVRTGPLVVRRDGARLYTVAAESFSSASLKTVDTATGAVANFSAAKQVFTGFISGLAANPVADRLWVSSAKSDGASGLFEYDTRTEQAVRGPVNVDVGLTGPLAISPEGARLYYGAPNRVGRPIAVHDNSLDSALGLIGELTELRAKNIHAGRRGRRVYTLSSEASVFDVGDRIRIFDALTLNPAPLAETFIVGATNLVASEDESRVFVAVTSTVSSTLSEADSAVIQIRRNRIDVVDALSGQTMSAIPLPDTSFRLPPIGSPVQFPDLTMALATTPPDASRCSYDVGPTQTVWTTAGGTATIALATSCTWAASSDAPWVRVSNAFGSGNATLTVTVDPAQLAAGRTATLTVAGRLLTISQAGFGTIGPFGSFDTPQEGTAGISGSLAVTGWALDDVGITRVRIFRAPVLGEPQGSPIFLGYATFVEGARPDVAAAFPSTPFATAAGWGLNLLTNMLPGQGNGTFTLYAYLDDVEGHTTVLGPRSFSSANSTSPLPFGAIDTPGEGESVSGTVVCFGWALTPQPNTIAMDGSTIDVIIDGLAVGHPVYNNPRDDIAALFPGYENSSGAVGYFMIDTTQYDNGIHTIAWVVRDSEGNAAGIGSRYFRIQN